MTLSRQPVLIGFAAADLLLAGLLVYQLTASLPELDPPVMHLKPKVPRAEAVVPVTTPALEAFAEIDARPMFAPDRKAAVMAQPGAASLAPPDVTLVGVIVSGSDSLAMLRTPSSPLATAYRIGATVSGWQLSEIAPDRVVLTAGPARNEIRLDANKAPPRPPAAPGSSQ
ncbi:MAG: hypothetical protein JOZ72_13480 [Alphaproteobacteria bacterium]|nr:hypothetical protein [Alphaproteobacteria bacterium]